MKKSILAILLLCVMTAFCIFSVIYTDSVCKKTEHQLREAETQCILNNFDSGLEKAEQARETWKKHECFLGVALRHTESDDVDILFPPLLEAIRQEDLNEFMLRNREMTATIRHLARAEMPYLFNIL